MVRKKRKQAFTQLHPKNFVPQTEEWKINLEPSKKGKSFRTGVTGFTLIELIAVVIIIAILSSIAYPNYLRAREKAIDKEAQAILVLIRAAERTYYMETGVYWTPDYTTVPEINSNLNLDITSDNWGNYRILSIQGFYALTERNKGGFNRRWWINSTMTNASCMWNCP